MTLALHDVEIIGENDYGYRFGVGRLDTRWIGFALGSQYAEQVRAALESEGLPVEPGMLFTFPEICEDFQLGIFDRRRCVLLTGALAQDPEKGYGGIEHWHVPEELRGKPDDFRCPHCDRIGCDGRECGEDHFDPMNEEG